MVGIDMVGSPEQKAAFMERYQIVLRLIQEMNKYLVKTSDERARQEARVHVNGMYNMIDKYHALAKLCEMEGY
jgi:hypothetical protein